MPKYNYHKEQLDRVKVGLTEYAPTIKVFANGNGEDTKHMSLDKESAEVLVKWLTTNFIKKPKKVVYDVTYLDADDDVIDTTQIDEKSKRLAWELFKEFGHKKKKGYRVEFEETTE